MTIFATTIASPTRDKTADVLKKLEQGINDVFASGRYAKYLCMMAKFHKYSYGNVMLILLQKPDATHVAGISTWNDLGRSVNKGEKAIQILAPAFFTKTLVDVQDQNGNPVFDPKTGKTQQVMRGVGVRYYKTVNVFDASQTSGQPLPELAAELQGTVCNFEAMLAALKAVSCPIEIQELCGNAKGYYSPAEHKIVIKANMSMLQTVKTICHEIAHSRLHRNTKQSCEAREVQAESVVYVVAQHFGLDTSEYSFDYLANWSSDEQLLELRQSLPIIQHEACALINEIEKELFVTQFVIEEGV